MEYDHEVEEIAMKRRSIEIDELFEQKVLNITVEVSSPKDVEASFLKDLGELVLRANEKLHIVGVNSKFAPTKFVTLDVFLKKHGGSSNDAVREATPSTSPPATNKPKQKTKIWSCPCLIRCFANQIGGRVEQ